jgi:hypothetical protein
MELKRCVLLSFYVAERQASSRDIVAGLFANTRVSEIISTHFGDIGVAAEKLPNT